MQLKLILCFFAWFAVFPQDAANPGTLRNQSKNSTELSESTQSSRIKTSNLSTSAIKSTNAIETSGDVSIFPTKLTFTSFVNPTTATSSTKTIRNTKTATLNTSAVPNTTSTKLPLESTKSVKTSTATATITKLTSSTKSAIPTPTPVIGNKLNSTKSPNASTTDVSTTPSTAIASSNSSKKDNALSILLMGDTQFHFKCEVENVACKRITEHLRTKYHLDIFLNFTVALAKVNQTLRDGQEMLSKMESVHSNKVQQQAMDLLMSRLPAKPAALIINGDLTQHGRADELEDFDRIWYSKRRIPMLIGLGNHDYEDPVRDCPSCVGDLLEKFLEYTRNNSFNVDVRMQKRGSKVEYSGSLGYTTRVCSKSGITCATVVQLNNAVNFTEQIFTNNSQWNLLQPKEYLLKTLKRHLNTSIPLLINVHQCESKHKPIFRKILKDWMLARRKAGVLETPRVAVLNAHWHPSHNMTLECLDGVTVPFVFVGSVPRNRFSKIDLDLKAPTITGFGAVLNGKKDIEVNQLKSVQIWEKCDFIDPKSYEFD